MNVTVEARDAVGTLGARKVLVATQDFAAGDVIYKVISLFISPLRHLDIQRKFHAS